VPVPEDQLPVTLPFIEDFKPDDSGSARSPPRRVVPRAVPVVRRAARRETDVSDTFLDSAWYFLRYPSARRDDVPFDPALTRKWLPVNSYIGGNEHAVLHLLYSRFITMVLKDAGTSTSRSRSRSSAPTASSSARAPRCRSPRGTWSTPTT
jgi:leucyl-tRNA synthetase